MSYSRYLVPGSVVLLLAAGVSACGSSSGGSHSASLSSGTTITIGVDEPISGVAALFGGAEEDGAKYAAQVVNSQHLLGSGVTLKLDVKDDQYTAAQSVINTNAIIASGDAAMFGPIGSADANATTALIGKKMLNVLTNADTTPLNSSDPDVYEITPPGSSTLSELGAYFQSKGVKTVAFISDSSAVNQPPLIAAAKSDWSADGIQVTGQTPVDISQTQFSATVNKVVAGHPDAIDILASPVAATIARELNAAGYKGVVATYNAPDVAIAPAGAAANGLVQPVFFSTLKTVNSEEQAFISGYQAANKTPPNSYNSEAYDSVMFIVQAIKAANSTNRAKIVAAAAALAKKGFTGVQGQYSFTDPAYDQRRASLPAMILVYGATGHPASVVKV